MKKIIVFIIFLLTAQSFSQVLFIDTNTYTPDDLVNKVLINSPCATGFNVKAKNGLSFGSAGSIGYFKNTNTSFPFSSGVVLSTGDVKKTPGPNTTILNDGTAAWTGDADLENNLRNQSGIILNSINASYIEFDFQPKTPNFDFSFLFASEEYGTSQCNFSDAFAFLLSDVTTGGPAINLALVPGTSSPVSVATIRDSAYNSNCSSVNPNYFGAFNGTGFRPAINFNGQTVKMVASAKLLNVNHVYKIKLVIADGGRDTGYDSAIFLEANSFNIGQNVLGPDLIAANNTALCPNTILPILSAAGFKAGTTYVWKKEGSILPLQTNVILDLNALVPKIEPGFHNLTVTYTEPGCVAVSDDIKIEIYPNIGTIPLVPPIYACDLGAGVVPFDLSKNTKIILAGANQATDAVGVLDDLPATTLITYHLSQADASSLTSTPIPINYSITTAENGKIIYARIQNPGNQCFDIRSFALNIIQPPQIASLLAPLIRCANSTTDSPVVGNFDLSAQISAVFGAQNPLFYSITFHNSLAEAQANTGILPLDITNKLNSATKNIGIRLQNKSDASCFVTTSFDVIVNPLPPVDVLKDAYVCTSYTLPKLSRSSNQYWSQPAAKGVQLFEGDVINTSRTIFIYDKNATCENGSAFSVVIVDPSTLPKTDVFVCNEYVVPSLVAGAYFYKQGGSTTAGNPEIPVDTKITTPGDTVIYYRFEDALQSPPCIIENKITVKVIPFTDLPDYPNQFGCSGYRLLPDPNGGQYFTAPLGDPSRMLLPVGTNITASQRIVVYKESATTPTNCSSEKTFDVFIGLGALTVPQNVTDCSYVLPNLVVGEYRDAAAGGGNVVPVGTLINKTTTLWYYIPGQSCTNNLSFIITVVIPPLPNFPPVGPFCDVYQLPAVAHTGNYFTGSRGTGTQLTVGDLILSTQRVYFFDQSGSCSLEESFLVTITPSAKIDDKPRQVIPLCGQTYFLDDLTFGEYYAYPQSSTLPNPILPAGYEIKDSQKIYVFAPATDPLRQCPSEYDITVTITRVNKIPDLYGCDWLVLPNIVGLGDYYTGPNGTGTKLTLPYAPITLNTKLYVYVKDNSRASCEDQDGFDVIIYTTPIVAPLAAIVRCGSYTLPALTAPATRYFSKPGGPATTGNIEKFVGDVITVSTTLYAYAEVGTSTTRICYHEKPLNIIIESKPTANISDQVICKDLITGTNQTITVSSGLTDPKYIFEWSEATKGIVGRNSDLVTNEPGIYTLKITDTSIFGCISDAINFKTVAYSIPKMVAFEVENWFEEKQTIVTHAVPLLGDGSNFLYTLDNGMPQESPVFTDVLYGLHSVVVSDKFGCGQTKALPIQLVYAPKFFTPNGDGFNDTWDVVGLKTPYTRLVIFDRYGKFLKELKPNSGGWDGFFNGNAASSDDYWFVVSYAQNGLEKEFRSHFSIKR